MNAVFRQVVAVLAGCWALAAHARIDINVAERGVPADGRTLVTATLQAVIDECSAQGGGEVSFPAGRYLTGTLQIKDNVTLRLQQDAAILGSTNAADYRNVDPFIDGTGAPLGYALLVALDARNIGIEGPGTIDGQGPAVAAVQKETGKYLIRPFLIRLIRCEGVALRDTQLRAAGAWTLHLYQSRKVTVDGVSIVSHGLANNDGIDVDSCEGVRITRCAIDTHDDAICLKATSPVPCRDIDVEDCVLKSRCAAFKMGTESLGDFENVRVSRCRVTGAGLGGIKLLSVDGAHLTNVTISDVEMENVRVPIMLRLGARLKTFREGDTRREAGRLQGIIVRNVRAKNALQLGVLISGIPGHVVEDVTLENIAIELPGGGTKADAAAVFEEKESAYPEVRMFGQTMPAHGLYLRHVNGVKVSGLTVKLAAPDERPQTVLIDAELVEFVETAPPSAASTNS